MKNTLSALILILILTGCKKEIDPYNIGASNVGLLTDSTQVKDLKTLFINDSIVKFTDGAEFNGNINNIEIFDKSGKKLLIVSPIKVNDSTSLINTVRIVDQRYKTDKGISAISTFKAINDNYKVSKVDNLINSIVVTVDEINASFTIDKKELPANMRFDNTMTISPVQIPDNAKVKFFMIHW